MVERTQTLSNNLLKGVEILQDAGLLTVENRHSLLMNVDLKGSAIVASNIAGNKLCGYKGRAVSDESGNTGRLARDTHRRNAMGS